MAGMCGIIIDKSARYRPDRLKYTQEHIGLHINHQLAVCQCAHAPVRAWVCVYECVYVCVCVCVVHAASIFIHTSATRCNLRMFYI